MRIAVRGYGLKQLDYHTHHKLLRYSKLQGSLFLGPRTRPVIKGYALCET